MPGSGDHAGAVASATVTAPGGTADARGLVAALALGAEAVVLGTYFLVTLEANAHPLYKQKLLTATEADTVRTTIFGHGWPDYPHWTLRTRFVEAWLGQEARGNASRADEPMVGQTIPRLWGQTWLQDPVYEGPSLAWQEVKRVRRIDQTSRGAR
jgi:NAD(P)H-dependent flavin oxidoreductase YrpB (nitropropane dioxygenase family)